MTFSNNPPPSNKKVLLITNLCSPYRVGLFELLNQKYKIKFLFFSKGEEKYYDGPVLLGNFDGEYISGFYILPKIKINPKLLFYLCFYDYSHLIKCINGPGPLFFSFLIAKIRSKKFILWTSLWNHPSTTFHKFSFFFVKILYKYSDSILTYGPHVTNYLTSLGIDKSKIFNAYQVQDNSSYSIPVSNEEVIQIRKSLGIKTSKVLLFVGRIIAEKGIKTLISAFKLLEFRDVSLILIGEGNLKQEYLNNTDNVYFTGRVPGKELYKYYASSDILILPSLTTKTFKEPWGFVVNEAMCAGCAIITSNAVGAGEGGLVINGVNGFIVPEGDHILLRNAIDRILSDNSLLINMKNMSKSIIKDWNYDKMAGGFVEALKY